MIPADELKLRHVYVVHSRNLLVGVWQGEGFIGIREKFGDRYLATESLNDPPGRGTAVATAALVPLPADIQIRETNPTRCSRCDQPAEYKAWGDEPPTKFREDGSPYPGRWVCEGGCADPRPFSDTYKPLYDFLLPLHEAEQEADRQRWQEQTKQQTEGTQHG